MGRRGHADPASEAFGGAPHGASQRVRGVLTWTCEETRQGWEMRHGWEMRGGEAAGGMNAGTVSSKRGPNTT
eukprot:4813562-Pyramimonas_sp.AAC.1